MDGDLAAAVRSFKQAAEQGHVQAMVNLGLIFSGGAGAANVTVKPDVGAAAAWFMRAASYGDANAQWMLGKMHYDGKIGPKPDMNEAMKVRTCE